MIDAKMTLEVQKNGVQRTVYIKEGETAGARRLIITLTNNGKVVGVVGKSVSAYIKTPTATSLITGATSVDSDTNTIIFSIPSLDTGTYYLELVIQDSTTAQIYSPTFCIIAEDALYPNASGSFTPESVYIIATSENFYNKTQLDTMFEDYATKATTYTKTETDALLGGKIDLPDEADDGQVLTYDGTTEEWIAADASGGGGEALIIELTGTETAGTYTTAVTFAEVDEAATTGSPMLIKYSEVVGGNTLTRYKEVCGFYLGYNMSLERYKYELYVFNGTGYTAFTFKTSGSDRLPTVKSTDSTFLPTIDNAPTQNSSNLVKSGGVYTAVAAKESTSNKTTVLYSGSTDTQYPSAKAVYDAIKKDLTITGTTATDVLSKITSGVNTLSITPNRTFDELLAKVTYKQMLTADGYILGSDITASFQTFDDYTDSYLYIPWNIIACGLIKNGWMVDEGRDGAYDDIGEKDAIYIKIGNIYPGASNNMKYSTNWTVQQVIYEDTNGDIVFANFEDI